MIFINEVLLREYIQEVISESIVSDLKQNYPFNETEIDKLSENDPSGRNKYLRWAIRQLENGGEVSKIIIAMNVFHDNPGAFGSKDVNSHTLDEILEKIRTQDVRSKTKQVKANKVDGSEKVYEDDTFVMFRIDTRKACVEYGRGTKWCISMAHKDGYWLDHTRISVFYFLIDKENHQKFAFDYQYDNDKIVVYDERDRYRYSLEEIYLEAEDYDREKVRRVELLQPKLEKLIRSDVKNSPWYRLDQNLLTPNEFLEFALKEPEAITIVATKENNEAHILKLKDSLRNLAGHGEKYSQYAQDALNQIK